MHRYFRETLSTSTQIILLRIVCILLLRHYGDSEQRDYHKRGKPDPRPRDPLVFFRQATFFSIAHISSAVAVGIDLISIRCIGTVIGDVSYMVVIKVMTCIAESVLIHIGLVWIRDRNTVVPQILYTISIYICRYVRGIGPRFCSDGANVSCAGEITRFARPYDDVAIGIKVDFV